MSYKITQPNFKDFILILLLSIVITFGISLIITAIFSLFNGYETSFYLYELSGILFLPILLIFIYLYTKRKMQREMK